jgi:hypothetical protein
MASTNAEQNEKSKAEEDAEYPSNTQRAIIMTAMYLTLFLVNLVSLCAFKVLEVIISTNSLHRIQTSSRPQFRESQTSFIL